MVCVHMCACPWSPSWELGPQLPCQHAAQPPPPGSSGHCPWAYSSGQLGKWGFLRRTHPLAGVQRVMPSHQPGPALRARVCVCVCVCE